VAAGGGVGGRHNRGVFAGHAGRIHLGRRRSPDRQSCGRRAQWAAVHLDVAGDIAILPADTHQFLGPAAIVGTPAHAVPCGEHPGPCGEWRAGFLPVATAANSRGVVGGDGVGDPSGQCRIRGMDHRTEKHAIGVVLLLVIAALSEIRGTQETALVHIGVLVRLGVHVRGGGHVEQGVDGRVAPGSGGSAGIGNERTPRE
jgi:hypothetical protein